MTATGKLDRPKWSRSRLVNVRVSSKRENHRYKYDSIDFKSILFKSSGIFVVLYKWLKHFSVMFCLFWSWHAFRFFLNIFYFFQILNRLVSIVRTKAAKKNLKSFSFLLPIRFLLSAQIIAFLHVCFINQQFCSHFRV